MLKYYTTGQLALIDVKRKTAKIGEPAMIRTVDVSPDGQYLRVTRMVEPFSYLVPVSSFGSVQELWDATGKVIATLAKTPLREGERSGDVPSARGRGAAADGVGHGQAKHSVESGGTGPRVSCSRCSHANGWRRGADGGRAGAAVQVAAVPRPSVSRRAFGT